MGGLQSDSSHLDGEVVQQMQISEQNRNYAKLKETEILFLTQSWSVGDIAKGLRRSESEINRLIGHEE